MTVKRPFETVDGKRFETLAQASEHIFELDTDNWPELIYVGGLPKYVLYENGAIEDYKPLTRRAWGTGPNVRKM